MSIDDAITDAFAPVLAELAALRTEIGAAIRPPETYSRDEVRTLLGVGYPVLDALETDGRLAPLDLPTSTKRYSRITVERFLAGEPARHLRSVS